MGRLDRPPVPPCCLGMRIPCPLQAQILSDSHCWGILGCLLPKTGPESGLHEGHSFRNEEQNQEFWDKKLNGNMRGGGEG